MSKARMALAVVVGALASLFGAVVAFAQTPNASSTSAEVVTYFGGQLKDQLVPVMIAALAIGVFFIAIRKGWALVKRNAG